MKEIIFLGDTHGDFYQIEKVTAAVTSTPIVHCGDLGLGFGLSAPETFPSNFHFIRGNHDNPVSARAYSNYLGDYGYNKELDLFYISGADSIDKQWRVKGVSWWPDEQLSEKELLQARDAYLDIKPRVVVSHTCPLFVTKFMVRAKAPTRTEIIMDHMWQAHKPQSWIFGHWHPEQLFMETLRETTFVCIPIDQAYVFKFA